MSEEALKRSNKTISHDSKPGYNKSAVSKSDHNLLDSKILNAEKEGDKQLLELNKRLAVVNAESAEIMADLEEKNSLLKELNERLARANANSANLMVELEEKNEELSQTVKELARANAHGAELMALLELKDEEIQNLNKALMKANVQAANLIADEEERVAKVHSLNSKLEKEIYERRKAEVKAIKASKAKSEFLAHMSHEIRTPMNGIFGMVNILKESKLNDEQREYVSIIDFSCENLLSIINDILDFSKIEAGQIEIEKIGFNLEREINGVVKLLSFKAKSKGIYLNYTIDPSIPSEILGDPVRLKQIIINLINNAIKFTEEGGVDLSIRNLSKKGETIILEFRIKDTGIGISKEGKDKLFKSYSQTDVSTTRKYGGTGLGLSISKSLTKLMKGEIGVESEEGKGSVFWFTIQVFASDKEEKKKIITAEKEVNTNENLKILLAEDNVINRKVAIFNFERLGHKIDIAENGRIAVEKVNENNYDIIFMDINMPELDGLEATKIIRKTKSKEMLPIVAMTAATSVQEKEMVFEAGMNDFISKPFKSEHLFNVLNKYTA